MSDEDFEPFVGGPPPDPSERTWRHPSELAAQAKADAMAAAGRDARGLHHRAASWARGRSLNTVLAGSIGAAACLAILAALSLDGSGNGGLDGGAIGASGVVEIDSLDADRTDSEVSTTSTTVASPGTTATPTTIAASVSTTAPSPAVFASAEEHLVAVVVGPEPVGSGVVLDGYVLTSASAVGDRLSITISTADGTEELAYLVGIDPFSDLAVFRPSIRARRSDVWSAISLRVLDGDQPTSVAIEPTGAAGVGGTTSAPVGQAVHLASITADGLTIDSGTVIDIDAEGETPGGQPLVGLIDTSIRRPVRGAGSLLLSDSGSPVGIVVDSTSSLAGAVPIDEALSIAGRLTEQGWANESWIGFVGMDIDGGVEVVEVARDGPAAAAGLLPGDVIAFLNTSPIDHMGGVAAGLRRAAPGDAVVIVVERGGAFVSLRVIAQSYRPGTGVTEAVGG